ncbi:MAG TPA: hypothetical protein VGM30_03595 [Puia sp.]|jgi:hypothetical protein
MGIIEQLAEIKRMEVLEEGRRIGIEEATRRFVENLLMDSRFPPRKIASLAGISLEKVRKINIMSIIDQLTERKRKEILEECHVRDYCDNYSIPHAKRHAESYKVGLQDGVELITRRLVENLLKDPALPLKRIASMAGISLESVKEIKETLQRK